MDVKALAANLDRSHVKTRVQGRAQVSYIEAWHAIAEANRIFGFGGWARETLEMRVVAEGPREIGQYKKPGFGVSYVARVRVTVWHDGATIIREGTGAGHGIDVDLGQCHESAAKEAESDAMKRALMTFGNPFGLALYDKTQANVGEDPASATERPAQRPQGNSGGQGAETPQGPSAAASAPPAAPRPSPLTGERLAQRCVKIINLVNECQSRDEFEAIWRHLEPEVRADGDVVKAFREAGARYPRETEE